MSSTTNSYDYSESLSPAAGGEVGAGPHWPRNETASPLTARGLSRGPGLPASGQPLGVSFFLRVGRTGERGEGFLEAEPAPDTSPSILCTQGKSTSHCSSTRRPQLTS